jgi:hypothetical protein
METLREVQAPATWQGTYGGEHEHELGIVFADRMESIDNEDDDLKERPMVRLLWSAASSTS